MPRSLIHANELLLCGEMIEIVQIVFADCVSIGLQNAESLLKRLQAEVIENFWELIGLKNEPSLRPRAVRSHRNNFAEKRAQTRAYKSLRRRAQSLLRPLPPPALPTRRLPTAPAERRLLRPMFSFVIKLRRHKQQKQRSRSSPSQTSNASQKKALPNPCPLPLHRG